jgi:hypothetical protein
VSRRNGGRSGVIERNTMIMINRLIHRAKQAGLANGSVIT